VVYQLQKAWRRNKVVYTAAAAVVIALLSGTGISAWQAWKANSASEREHKQRLQSDADRKIAVEEQRKARESEINALQRAYNSDMSVAFRALEENLIGRAQDIVSRHVPEPDDPDFRGWEWRYAWAQSRSDAVHTWNTPADMGIINAIRISPDQQHLVSSERRSLRSDVHRNRRLWNIQTRQELKRVLLPGGSDRGLAFSNAGDFLALHHLVDVNNRNEVHIYETSTWQHFRRMIKRLPQWVTLVPFFGIGMKREMKRELSGKGSSQSREVSTEIGTTTSLSFQTAGTWP
jgi:hypothetical protein